MQPNKKDLQIAERFKTLLLKHRIPLVKTVIFGSRARGDADVESDLDMLIVLKKRTPEICEKISNCAWEVGFEADVIIQTVVMTRDQLEGPERSSLLMCASMQRGFLFESRRYKITRPCTPATGRRSAW